MSEIFIGFFNRSMAAGWLILALLILRPLLKKAPKWTMPLFWGLVAIRLICPFTLTSELSLLPSGEVLPSHVVQYETPAISSGIPILDEAVNPILAQSLSPAPGASANPLYVWTSILGFVWAIVATGLLLYALARYGHLKYKLHTAVLTEHGVYESEVVSSPFLLGFVRPNIYLPAGLNGTARSHVLAHEKSHLARKDHWSKAFGYALTCLYWFHPLVWIGYALFCRDLELACDEKVLRALEPAERIEYSQTLLSMAAKGSHRGCPLAFGETGVKERIKASLAYRRRGLWLTIVAVLLCIILGICFLTNPASTKETLRLISMDDDWITYAVNTEKECIVHIELWQEGVCVFHDSSAPLSQFSQLILHLHNNNANNGSRQFTFQLDTDRQGASYLTAFTLEQDLLGWSTIAWNPDEIVTIAPEKNVVLLGRFFDVYYGSVHSYGNCRILTENPTLYQSAPCALVVRIEVL